jgi:sugar lactone lactonase YvrE
MIFTVRERFAIGLRARVFERSPRATPEVKETAMRPLPAGFPLSVRIALPKNAAEAKLERGTAQLGCRSRRARRWALTLECLETRTLLSALPTVTTNAATSISTSGVTLNASVNPQGSSTVARFQYSTDPSFPVTVPKIIGSGFEGPNSVAVDAAGDVFVADTGNSAVMEVLPNGSMKPKGSGFSGPLGVAVDATGDVFVADTGNSAVTEVLSNGTIKNISSQFNGPIGVAVDAAGDVFVAYIADIFHGFVKEVLPDGTISTIGSGFRAPFGVAVDAAGDVFVADTLNDAVKEVLPNGTILPIGSGFNEPSGVAVNSAGDVFVADTGSSSVKEVLPSGTIKTIGSGFKKPEGVAVDAAGDVFVADTGNNRVVELSPPSVAATPAPLNGSTASPVTGSLTGLTPGVTYYYRVVASSAGGTVTDFETPPQSFTTKAPASVSSTPPSLGPVNIGAGFIAPFGVTVDASGDLFFADPGKHAVKEILPNGTIKTIGAHFKDPTGVAVDAAGDVFVADTGHHAVKEVLPNGVIKIIGSHFKKPRGVAVDSAGEVFVIDTGKSAGTETGTLDRRASQAQAQRQSRFARSKGK